MSPGVEGAKTIVYFGIGFVATGVRLKVEAGTKGCGSIGGSTHPTLNLDVFHRGGKVRHVDPKDPVRLCIVEWNAIDGSIDAGLVGSSNPNTRVAHPGSCVRVADYGRGKVEKNGNVLPQISLGDFRLIHSSEGGRCAFRGAGSGHNEFLAQEILGFQT